ncbi:hypothetical protein AXF42_Ash009452 [Apostasia shenzhenica]|uniref:Uncharacterized protein n=1 Tax=Apostasia shenzhenica TaxID=1088818 RepID=A0A2I0B8W1_9ASPA|nr:hypothetical protein AXF42_Ash009452 [Apostasia shenzhenica]
MAAVEGEQRPAPARKGQWRLLLALFVAALVLVFSYLALFSNSSGAVVPSCPSSAGRVSTGRRARQDGTSYIQLPGMTFNAKSQYLLRGVLLYIEMNDVKSMKWKGFVIVVLGKCNLFSGEWVCNPSGPAYNNVTCNVIDAPQNCMKNGRPETEYLYWRWKPYDCDLPAFDPFKFMNSMKDKSWAFIGDSIFRNHIQSVLCLLSKVEEPVEVYHDKPYKSRTWHFANSNLTLANIWAPFLVKSEANVDDEGRSKSEIQLHLDTLDPKWTDQYDKYDYILFSGGQWFLKTMVMWENNTAVGCHNCQNKNLKELGFEYAYRKALSTTYDFMISSSHKPMIIFRTWTPDHFEYGEWFSGGICNRTIPYYEGQYGGKSVDHDMIRIEVDEFDKAAVVAAEKGARLSLLNTFHLSLLRPDGHPGPFRTFHPFEKDKHAKVQNDCLHWCLPGPIDTWNELIMKMLVDSGDISFSAS